MKRLHLAWQVGVAIILVLILVPVLSKLNIVKRGPDGLYVNLPLTNNTGVRFTHSQYRTVSAKPSGWFETSQAVDLVLSAIDFNNSGGPLLFNHPGNLASDGKNLILADRNNNRVLIWNQAPLENNTPPSLVIGQKNFTTIAPGDGLDQLNRPVCAATDGKHLVVGEGGYHFIGGDGSGSAFAGDVLYLSLSNGNKIVGYTQLPVPGSDRPDLVIGSPDAEANTLEEEFIISNLVPATDGQSLFVLSDFDRKLYVWEAIPAESGAHPDIVYNEITGNDLAIRENTLVIGGQQEVDVWKRLPLNGEQPDLHTQDNFGGIELSDVRGIALDQRHLYLADQPKDRIYIWEGIPDKGQKPVATLSINHPGKLSSDGDFLGVSRCQGQPGGGVAIFRIVDIEKLGSAAKASKLSFQSFNLNLPGSALVYDGSLFIAQGNNHVVIWNNIQDAIDGLSPDVVLGKQKLTDYTQTIGRDSLFMPHTLAFDGSFLWVGEVKFSERLLRFSVR